MRHEWSSAATRLYWWTFFYSWGHAWKNKSGLYSLLLHAVPYCEEPVVNISWVCCVINHGGGQKTVQDLFFKYTASSGGAEPACTKRQRWGRANWTHAFPFTWLVWASVCLPFPRLVWAETGEEVWFIKARAATKCSPPPRRTTLA